MEYIINVMDLVIKVRADYELLSSRLAKYVIKDASNVNIDFSVSLSDSTMEKLKEAYKDATPDVIEYMLTGAIFYSKIINYNAFLLHSSSVVVNNKAYSFSADSGVGKSTHTSLYLNYFKDSYIINDDKPAYRLIDNKWYVYGTPWSGKNDISENKRVPLQGICFISRGLDNKVRKLDNKEAINKIMKQTMLVKGYDMVDKMLALIDRLLKDYNIYEISCDISNNAMLASYNALNGGLDNEN